MKGFANALFWLLAAAAPAMAAEFTYQLVLLEGDTQPGGIVFTDFQSAPGINNADQILFGGSVGSLEGLWLVSGSQLTTVAIEDADVAGILNAKFDSFSSGIEGTFLADDGRVFFAGRLKGTGITTSNDLTLWAGLPASLQLVMREGSPAPGAPGQNFVEPSSTLSTSTHAMRLQEGGVVGFAGRVNGTPGPLNDLNGVWTGTAGTLTPAIRSGQASDHGQIVNVFTFDLGLAPNGDAYLMASTGVGARGLLWRGNGGTATRLFVEGGQAPGAAAGSVFSDDGFTNIFFSAPNFFSFTTNLNTQSGERFAFFAGPDGMTTLALLQGTPAPELAGLVLRQVSGAPANEHGGQVAVAILESGGGVTTANDQAFYYIPPGGAVEQWQLIVREGDPVPGIENAFWGFGILSDFCAINSSGLVAFLNTLTGSGVTSATDRSLWIWEPATNALSLVAREGTPIDFGNGNIRTPSILSFRGGEGRPVGLTSGLNNANKIVFEALGTDFKEMIAIAELQPAVDLRLTSITKNGNSVLIQGVGIPSAVHEILATNDLSQPFDSTPIGTPTADSNGNFQFTDNTALARRFYRATVP